MIPTYMYWPVAILVTFVVVFFPTMVAVFRAEDRKVAAEDTYYSDRRDAELALLNERCRHCGDLLYGPTLFPSRFDQRAHARADCVCH